MESKKIIAATTITSLVFVLLVLWLNLRLSRNFYITASITLAVILVILVWILIGYIPIGQRKLSMARSTEGPRVDYSFLRKVAGLPAKFPLEVLQAATDNFQAVLGRGSSGSVFKGILDDGTPIAVKRIEGAEHGDMEFQAEIAAIASIQHVNLVRLVGYCLIPSGPRYLVYEFVHHGSLDNWIFYRIGHDQHQFLPWSLRYRVAIDVAKALAYLHHDCRSRILHLDIKPENILLDDNFRAVVSDFGLSKLMMKDESKVLSTVRGTIGYLAPEWFLHSGISEKSDVYSYGMVVLELLGGRRNARLMESHDGSDQKLKYFPRLVAERERQGRIMEVVDERLMMEGDVDDKQLRVLVCVALWCIQEDGGLRPSMDRVVDMLEGRISVNAPPKTEMVVVDFWSIEQDCICDSSVVFQSDSRQPEGSGYSFAMSAMSGR